MAISRCSRLVGRIPQTTIKRAVSSKTKSERFQLKGSESTKLPANYIATGIHCGIKKNQSFDLALIHSTSPWHTSAAACFTKNAFQAAPILVSKQVLAQNNVKSVVISSGNANAATGKQGIDNAWAMSKAADDLFRQTTPSTLVMSTGVIGQHLPMQRILPAIKSSCLPTMTPSFASWEATSQAFMTTDTFPKMRIKQVSIPGRQKPFTMVGIDKGAGMIAPRMGPPHATLLGLIATDAAVEDAALQAALTYAVDRSFNSISIDGDMSTNDTIFALANGAAWGGKDVITQSSQGFEEFRDALTEFCVELSSLIVRDGEGATKFITINVEECPSYDIAHHIASTISNSTLLKCAIHGEDANWGRVLCAVGYSDPSGFQVDPEKVSIAFNDPTRRRRDLRLMTNGQAGSAFDEDYAKQLLADDNIEITVKMGSGQAKATCFTCDLSKDYIDINANYRS